jgi:hypothetical protein
MNKQKNLPGKWIIRYNPEDFSPSDVWEWLGILQEWINQQKIDQPEKNIVFDKSIKKNLALSSAGHLSIQIKNRQPIDLKKEDSQNPISTEFEFNRKTKKILLIYPVLPTDKRWVSIDLPTASLYLASALTSQYFRVTIKKVVFPFIRMDENIQKYDVIGITLYEDLFTEIKEFLIHLRNQFQGLIAAGGPMVTLNPFQTAYHLPQINLLIRGEAELVFPELLKAIQKNNLSQLLKWKGFVFHDSGRLLVSEYSEVNYPGDLTKLKINLEFLRKNHLTNGLELNVTRGCYRRCFFCSKVQGNILRKIPLDKIEFVLNKHSEKIQKSAINSPGAKTINLNDDDILQDHEYARKLFNLIKKNKYKLWGIQTSINSFFVKNRQINREVLRVVSDPDLFVDRKPVIWLGTDAFVKKRGEKIGKMIPGAELLIELITEFEKREISNYHYWISSDQGSNWGEFLEEVLFLFELLSWFKTFAVLAHSPFLVPYSATPLYSALIKNPAHQDQIKYKNILKSSLDIFEFPLVDRLETRFPNLNRLLKNEKINEEKGFFDFLKQRQKFQALKTVYSFLRQERISFESLHNYQQSRPLKKLETKLETVLSGLV